MIDLVFILDMTYLASAQTWANVRGLATSIVSQMTIGPNNVQVGVITYGFSATSRFYLNTYTTQAQVVAAINALTLQGDWSNVAAALTEAQNNQFISARGDRSNANNVVILITPQRADQNANLVASTAAALRATGVQIYAVGTNTADAAELQTISSPPQTLNTNYFFVTSDTQLSSLSTTLYSLVCPLSCPGKSNSLLYLLIDLCNNIS
jgi:hypothetical protein